MYSIRAIYKIPSRHLMFLIFSYTQSLDNNPILSLKDLCVERIDLAHWKLGVILENDFVSCSFFQKTASLEMLCINKKNSCSSSSDLSLQTPRHLSAISEEDIIEVFL